MNIQVVGVESIAGRRHEYVRVFGVRENDAAYRIVEVALPVHEAEGILLDYARDKEYPMIEVPERGWTFRCPEPGTE